MPSRSREDALSEVIGFILILALIAVLASLYLTYVVPAQGREGEIKHMAGINDQFLGYKAAVDSLWINDQRNVPISRTFTLGTLTGTTQGSFVIPMFQPYPSSGSMVVNGRSDTITIQADALVQGFPGSATPNLNPMYYEPDHIYVQVMTTNISKYGGIIISPNRGNWSVVVNVSSMMNFNATFSETIVSNIPPIPTLGNNAGNREIEQWITDYLINWTTFVSHTMSTQAANPILAITMIKNNNSTFSRFPIYSYIQNNNWYTIDILDDAYGLEKELDYPFNITITNSSSNWIQYRYPVPRGYIPTSLNESHPMGSLQFNSNNNYWINQNYYYQQGGVFLAQPGDGMVTKVMPFISITDHSGIPIVRIVDFSIIGSGNIGGTSPVQIITTLNSATQNVMNGYSLAQGIPNAKNVAITVDAQDAATAQMWNQTFAGIKSTAGGQSWIVNTQTGNQATLTIDPLPGSSQYDVILDYSRVNMSVELQPVAL